MRTTGVRDGIWVDDQYYILATSARASGRSAVLKCGETFAVFDRTGDIAGPGEHGLYHDGTRHLSMLTLSVGGDLPLLLSSRTSSSNELFGADLTNPDVLEGGAITLQRDLVHIFRSRFLTEGHAYERIRLVNYSQQRVTLEVGIRLAADFVDIFEVRGTRRARRGSRLPTRVDGTAVELAYQGLDDLVRRTRLTFDPPPASMSESAAVYAITLDAHESATAEITVTCAATVEPAAPAFDAAFALVEQRSRRMQNEYARVWTSNQQFNGWMTQSLADVRLMTSDTAYGPYPYAGVPWFSTPFGRDGIITALEMLWINTTLARGVLQYLAATQADRLNSEQDAEPGKILHETRGGEMAALGEVPFGRYFGSVDSTPLFVILACEYYRRTADLPFVASIWTNVERAVAWMTDYGDVDGDGFLEYQRRTPSGLVHQGWKDSQDSVFHDDGLPAEPPIALCEVQGYAYAAWRGASVLAAALGHSDLSASLAGRASTLRERFDAAFWLDDLGTYALALDGAKRPCMVRSSNAGHCLFTGIVDAARARRVADSLMGQDLFSGWGIRTIGTREARYNPMAYHNGSVWPHDNALAAAGLGRYGLTDGVVAIAEGLFDASLHVDVQRMPELFCGFRRRPGEGPTLYPVACAPQSWAAGAVFLILQSCLGLSIDAVESQVHISHARLPQFLDRVTIHGLTIGAATSVDLLFDRHAHDVSVTVLDRTGTVAVIVTK
jgi:glycogen debranching enzyme